MPKPDDLRPTFASHQPHQGIFGTGGLQASALPPKSTVSWVSWRMIFCAAPRN